MARPTTMAISAALVVVIGLLVVLAFKSGKRPTPAPEHGPGPVTEPASSGREAVDRPPEPPARPAAAVARSAVPSPEGADARKPLDEESLLARLHELAGSNPDLSLTIAREAVSRFPDSPNAPEFEWNVVKALFNQRRLEDAEAEARIMLSKYPDSYFSGDVEHHLLNHPPNPPGVP